MSINSAAVGVGGGGGGGGGLLHHCCLTETWFAPLTFSPVRAPAGEPRNPLHTLIWDASAHLRSRRLRLPSRPLAFELKMRERLLSRSLRFFLRNHLRQHSPSVSAGAAIFKLASGWFLDHVGVDGDAAELHKPCFTVSEV